MEVPSDGNGIIFAPMCKNEIDRKCFTSDNKKICEHEVNAIKLDTVGDFVVYTTVDITKLLLT